MDIILDSAALLSGRINSIPEEDRLIITDLVKEEIKRGAPARQLERLTDAGLMVKGGIDTEKAVRAAEITGDLKELSPADISVIALAIELSDPLVLTDDFRVQNVLRSLNIRFEPAGEIGGKQIREQWEWTYRCRGCGRYFENDPGKDCPVCGHQIRKTRKIR